MSDINHITDQSELFPPLLREAVDAPTELYIRGNVELLHHEPMLGVVGSRKSSPYGKQALLKLLDPVVKAGVPLVSGLAYGIDSLAHRLCVDHDTPTIAVLGSGIDDASIYPKSHISLAAAIVQHGGAVISEYPPETPAFKSHFPARNRIIAGLSQAVLIVQAATRSGSLITARQALESGREVAAVPGPITDERSAGTNRLIRDGATPAIESTDIFELLGVTAPTINATPAALAELSVMERTVYDALTSQPLHIDTIIARTKQSAADVSLALTQMELTGIVQNSGGSKYTKRDNT